MNASGDGPFQASYIAASTSDPSQTDSVENQLAAVVRRLRAGQRHLRRPARHGHAPDHADGDDRRQRHLPLYVKSNSVDTFALSYSGTDFNAGIVPAGWRVEFRSPTAGTCDAPGAQIMNARVTETADRRTRPRPTPR